MNKNEDEFSDTKRFKAVKSGKKADSDDRKEEKMNIKRINEGIKALQEDLGDALIATDLWTVGDAVSLAGYNPQPKAVALFNRITDNLIKTLKGSGFPGIRKYYLLDLEDDKMVIVLPLGEFQWGMLLDSKKAPLGLILNVALPRALEAFEKALKE